MCALNDLRTGKQVRDFEWEKKEILTEFHCTMRGRQVADTPADVRALRAYLRVCKSTATNRSMLEAMTLTVQSLTTSEQRAELSTVYCSGECSIAQYRAAKWLKWSGDRVQDSCKLQ